MLKLNISLRERKKTAHIPDRRSYFSHNFHGNVKKNICNNREQNFDAYMMNPVSLTFNRLHLIWLLSIHKVIGLSCVAYLVSSKRRHCRTVLFRLWWRHELCDSEKYTMLSHFAQRHSSISRLVKIFTFVLYEF